MDFPVVWPGIYFLCSLTYPSLYPTVFNRTTLLFRCTSPLLLNNFYLVSYVCRRPSTFSVLFSKGRLPRSSTHRVYCGSEICDLEVFTLSYFKTTKYEGKFGGTYFIGVVPQRPDSIEIFTYLRHSDPISLTYNSWREISYLNKGYPYTPLLRLRLYIYKEFVPSFTYRVPPSVQKVKTSPLNT